MWPDGDTLGTLVVRSKLSNNCRLVNDVAIWRLEEWHEAAIDFLVPLSFDSEIGLTFLELNFFGL